MGGIDLEISRAGGTETDIASKEGVVEVAAVPGAAHGVEVEVVLAVVAGAAVAAAEVAAPAIPATAAETESDGAHVRDPAQEAAHQAQDQAK